MTHCRLGWHRRAAAPLAFALPLTLLPAMGFAKEYREEYHCVPDTQYECTGGQCEKVADGFRQVESFAYNVKTGMLSACLWTNCYAAKVTPAENPADDPAGTGAGITVTGKLMPAAHPGNEPVIVSLAIHSGNNRDAPRKKAVGFTAVWGYGNKGLTLDMGECGLRELP